MNANLTPDAYLLRQHTARGGTRIMCGEVFMQAETAAAAAKRKTTRWRVVEAVAAFASPIPPTDPSPSWRCFHCDELFRSERSAREHFGPHEHATPACQIKGSEGGLLRALREAEAEVEKAWSLVHSEGAEALMAWRGALSRHHAAVRSAEETGFARGMDAMREQVERLRRILHRYGDRVPMATSHSADWQQEIDDAMQWVADNPESEAA